MLKINPHLFVYGTLLNGSNPFGAILLANSSFVNHAKFKGNLYDIGEYPGAVAADSEDCWVHGRVFLLNNPEQTLKILDGYEGFGEGQPKPNLFIRALVEVETDEKMLLCWIYLYNLPVHGLRQIVSGRYRD